MSEYLSPNASAILEAIVPMQYGNVMDILEEAGIDVSAWKVRKDGTPVQRPRANPNYCYEWSFGGNGEETALCVWHDTLVEVNGQVVYDFSMRDLANQLDVESKRSKNSSQVRNRSRDQARRARKFDEAIRTSFEQNQAVRAILLVRASGTPKAPGQETSRVRFRSLDDVAWYVHEYKDTTGQFRLVRGVEPEGGAQEFVDQFDIPETPAKVAVSGLATVRLPEVRRKALKRANGKCELCGETGFLTVQEKTYLETHHVISLAEGGPDVVWNVVGICPNCHRRCHHGSDRNDLKEQAIARLISVHPGAESKLRELLMGKDSK